MSDPIHLQLSLLWVPECCSGQCTRHARRSRQFKSGWKLQKQVPSLFLKLWKKKWPGTMMATLSSDVQLSSRKTLGTSDISLYASMTRQSAGRDVSCSSTKRGCFLPSFLCHTFILQCSDVSTVSSLRCCISLLCINLISHLSVSSIRNVRRTTWCTFSYFMPLTVWRC